MLEQLDDPHFTTELGLFNLEANCDPQPFGGDGLSQMEQQLDELDRQRARTAAPSSASTSVLTGILPTLRKTDLGLDNMMPSPRYHALNKAMTALRGGTLRVLDQGPRRAASSSTTR